MHEERTPFIQVNNLYKVYRMGDEKVYAINGLDLTVDRGETICLLGPSGSGKSTLLNALAGLERPTKGEIIIGGIHLEKLSEAQITAFRSLNVGFVFQSYNLLPNLTALENVSLGLMLKGMAKEERNRISKLMLERVGLSHRLHHKPNELSGGQQQRVSIARALVGSPSILFADEPTGNLDMKTGFEVMELIKGITEAENQTLIMVTHNEELTVYADRMFHMRDGKIERIRKRNGEEEVSGNPERKERG